MKINESLHKRITQKAYSSSCKFKIAAIAFSKKGNILGIVFNNFRFSGHGGGLHAEIKLIQRYGNKISWILIGRVGRSGDLLPIEPCQNCQKVADKLGIKIESILSN